MIPHFTERGADVCKDDSNLLLAFIKALQSGDNACIGIAPSNGHSNV